MIEWIKVTDKLPIGDHGQFNMVLVNYQHINKAGDGTDYICTGFFDHDHDYEDVDGVQGEYGKGTWKTWDREIEIKHATHWSPINNAGGKFE